MRNAAVLIHADPSMRARYEAQLPPGTELLIVNAGAYSSAYRALDTKLKWGHSGTRLSRLIRYAGGQGTYDTITLASFSAGYPIVQGLLEDPAVARWIDAVVSIDSWHTGFDTDGTARDSQLTGLVRQALRAADDQCVVWLAHTDVHTPQTGTNAFASTTQVASEVYRLAGLSAYPRQPTSFGHWPGLGVQRGDLRIVALNLHKSDHDEHVAALRDWGAEWLGHAMRAMLTQKQTVQPEPGCTEAVKVALGQRALARGQSELVARVREIPGPNHNKRILEYLAGCERGGKLLHLATDETAWCAAAASWCAFFEASKGEAIPHRWRAAVRELWEDLIARGAAMPAAAVRRGDVTPQPGDLAIMTRGGPAFGSGVDAFKHTQGLGHMGRVAEWRSDGTFVDLEGNVNNTWAMVEQDVSASHVVGFGAYPSLVESRQYPTTDEALAGLYMLDIHAIGEKLWRGEFGMEHALAGVPDYSI